MIIILQSTDLERFSNKEVSKSYTWISQWRANRIDFADELKVVGMMAGRISLEECRKREQVKKSVIGRHLESIWQPNAEEVHRILQGWSWGGLLAIEALELELAMFYNHSVSSHETGTQTQLSKFWLTIYSAYKMSWGDGGSEFVGDVN